MVELTTILIDLLRNNLPNPHASGQWIYADYPRCFTEDVEVLSEHGWKKMSHCSIGEKILTFDPETFTLQYEPILDKIETKYKGPIINFISSQLRIGLTPNHRLPIKWGSAQKVRWCTAQELTQGMYLPRTGKWIGLDLKEIEMPSYTFYGKNQYSTWRRVLPSYKIQIEKFLPLLGLYLTEGYLDKHLYIIITQRKKETRELIHKYLSESGFRFSENKEAFVVTDRRVGSFFKDFARDCYSKFIPYPFKELPPEKLKILLYWLMLGDGSPVDKATDGFEFYTTSKQLADDVYELILKIGRTPRLRVKHPKLGRPCFAVKYYSRAKNLKTRYHLEKTTFDGKVYCLSTPSHTLIVRNKNGQVFFSGNSDATFPRISVTQTSGNLDEVGIGEWGNQMKGHFYSITYDIDIWVKVNDRATINSETYVGTKLRDKYADLVLQTLTDNKDTLRSNKIVDVEITGITTSPIDEENMLHRKTITIRVTQEREVS